MSAAETPALGPERVARAAWSRLVEPGDRLAVRVVTELGAASALDLLQEDPGRLVAVLRGGRLRGGDTPDPATSTGTSTGVDEREARGAEAAVARWRVRLPDLDPGRDLATVARFGGRLVIPGDPQWPTDLDLLESRAPLALWVRGPVDLAAACRRSVALVGARACTGYGEHTVRELSAGVADRRICVVSGAAYGIDAMAHRGALAVDGVTVAFLACGVDRPYPRGNERLIERIAVTGAVVSEVAPGSSPTRWRFVQRNRLIAAATQATVVVEAAWRSGAMITAGLAADLGRQVAAVPGPVTSPMSAGCHRLLREGATCVTDAAEVAELMGDLGEQLALVPDVPASVHDGLGALELRVLDALPLRSAVPLAAVARTAGLETAAVTAALGRLELRGVALSGGGLWRRAPTDPNASRRDGRRPPPRPRTLR
jgi:DNA processing protein